MTASVRDSAPPARLEVALGERSVVRLGWGESVVAQVLGNMVCAANGLAAIPIQISAGSIEGVGMLVDVPALLIPDAEVGSELRAWGLSLRSAEPLTLAWCSGSSGVASVGA